MPTVINGTTGITFTDNTIQNTAAINFRNRIINGGMVIDQRNAGAAVTTSGLYVTDRFTQAFGNASCSFQQVSDAPSGFINSLKLTVTTGAAPSSGTNNAILQKIEGLNVADLAWGTASASSVTLSFWVKASVTGTYAVAFTNSAFNRSYVQTYVVNSANTWEYKTVTISGDTSGTWLTTNGVGLTVLWDFGSGTSLNTTAGAWQAGNFYRTSACTTIASTTNATLAITGVQLERGSTASSFDFRSYGQELALCQRYYEKSYELGTVPGGATGTGMLLGPSSDVGGGLYTAASQIFRVEKRSTPSMAYWDVAGNANRTSLYNASNLGRTDNNNNVWGIQGATSGLYMIVSTAANNFWAAQWAASSEL